MKTPPPGSTSRAGMPDPTGKSDPRAVSEGTTLIRLDGSDALAVLHRISTQSLLDLTPGHARITLFCDFRGRLLHRAVVAVTADHAVWLLRDDAPAPELATHVERHVFREDVVLADHSAGSSVDAVEAGGFAPGTLSERAGIPARVQIEPEFGYVIGGEVAMSVAAPRTVAAETARILAGRPRHGHEVESAFHPLEVGLAHEVHLSKGCYTGQEALLRLVTYQSIRRRLARVRGPGDAPSVPRPVLQDGAPVGRLTSAAPDAGAWIGLAVLARDAWGGTPLVIEGVGAIEAPVGFPEKRPLGLP